MKNIKISEHTRKIYRERGVNIWKVEEAVHLFFETMEKNELSLKDMEAAVEIVNGHYEMIRRKIKRSQRMKKEWTEPEIEELEVQEDE